jgi:hypothetical protein
MFPSYCKQKGVVEASNEKGFIEHRGWQSPWLSGSFHVVVHRPITALSL